MKKKSLKIGILDFTGIMKSKRDVSPTTIKEIQALREAIKKRNHIPVVYKVEKCQLYFYGRNAEILYNNKKIQGCDILIPRTSVLAELDLEVSIIKQFQLMNIPVLNEYMPVQRAKNKLRTLQILTQKHIPVPDTIVVRKMEYIDKAIEMLGGYPVIIKSPFGSFGVGVMIVESRRSLHSALDILWLQMESSIILIQQYVAEADGCDYRAFVVADKVVAAMKRTAKKGDFRSNLHLGGEAGIVTLTEEEKKLAIKSAHVLGLNIAGVDILRSKKGPVIMEVNGNPGFYGLAKITGIDVAGEIIKYAESYVTSKHK